MTVTCRRIGCSVIKLVNIRKCVIIPCVYLEYAIIKKVGQYGLNQRYCYIFEFVIED